MKKFFSFLLMMIYGVTSFGMILHLHYCCGKLDKISFSSKIAKACDSRSAMQTKKCCDNKEYELKIKADQEIAYTQIIKNVAPYFVPLSFYTSNIFFASRETLSPASVDTGPLIFSNIPLFITNCAYRI